MALTPEEQRRLTQSGAAVPVAVAGGLGGPATLTNTFPGNRLTGRSIYAAPAAPSAVSPATAALNANPQVQADRAAARGFGAAAADAFGDAGRAAADIAALPVRGVVGAYDTAVVRPMRALGVPAAYLSPALVPNGVDPASPTPFTDQKRMQQQAALGAPAQATQAQVRAVDRADQNNPDNLPLYTPPVMNSTTPVATATNPADVPAVPGTPEAAAQQQPAASDGLGGTEDTRRRLAALEASNAQVAAGARGPAIIDNGNPNRNADFNDAAAMRTAAARTTTTRRGTTMDPAAQVYADQLLGRARERTAAEQSATQLAQTGLRETGENARAGLREQGASSRAAAANTIEQARLAGDQQRVAIAEREQQNRDSTARYDNATRQRIEAVQQEIATAKTPEARRAAAEKLAALTGKATQDNFAALELGGGSTVDPTTGIAVPQPKSAIIYNKATGTYEQLGGGAAAAPKAAIAEGTISTVNGKSARYTGGKWVPL